MFGHEKSAGIQQEHTRRRLAAEKLAGAVGAYIPPPTMTAVNGAPPLSVASSQVLQTNRPNASSENEVFWK